MEQGTEQHDHRSIDLREGLVGADYLEQQYGHNPELLAQNTALGLYLAADEVEQMLSLGKQHDVHLISQPSTELLDGLLGKLEQHDAYRSGYAILTTLCSEYVGYPSKEGLEQFISNLRQQLQRYFAGFKQTRSEALIEQRESIKHNLGIVKYMTEKYLEGVFSSTKMMHENGEDIGFESEHYTDYFNQFLYEPILGGDILQPVSHNRLQIGTYHRFVAEAVYLYRHQYYDSAAPSSSPLAKL